MSEPEGHSPIDIKAPVLVALNTLTEELLGINLMMVHPTRSGWAQDSIGKAHERPEFCQLVQSSREGARQCRMCHILMSVAAASLGACEQRCHAGCRVLVAPIQVEGADGHAVLSSCTYSGPMAVAEVRARAKALGIGAEDLVTAFRGLRELPEEKITLGIMILNAACAAGQEVLSHLQLKQKLSKSRQHHDTPSPAVAALETSIDALQISEKQNQQAPTPRSHRLPHVIQLVANLIDKRPYLPFSVNELAAASRLTRTHFSTLFHKQVGRSFSDYLTDRRMTFAMALLRNPRLNISEVAHKSGYDDPGYFARRFRRKTGLSPRVWRQQRVVGPEA